MTWKPVTGQNAPRVPWSKPVPNGTARALEVTTILPSPGGYPAASCLEVHIESNSDWPWDRSLATARADTPLRVERILFGIVRDRCSELGIREGSVVVCRDRNDTAIGLELPGGTQGRMAREYAWFVLVGRVH